MDTPRRAAMRGAAPALVAGVRAALTVRQLALAGVLAALAFVSVHMARRVVTPRVRAARHAHPRARHRGADDHALAHARHASCPGATACSRAARELHQARLGARRGRRRRVKRKLLTHIAADAQLSPRGRLQRLVLRPPRPAAPALHPRAHRLGRRPVPRVALPRRATGDVLGHPGARARHDARRVPARGAASSTTSGITSLVVSYRNDGEAPRSRAGTYALGATEWRDVDAAVGFARRRGAKRIVLMGWSMGGAIALQLSLNSAHRDVDRRPHARVAGRRLARRARVPGAAARRAARPSAGWRSARCRPEWATPITRRRRAPSRSTGSTSSRARPSCGIRSSSCTATTTDSCRRDASHDLVAARPDLVDAEGLRGRAPHEAVELRPGALERQHPPWVARPRDLSPAAAAEDS